MEKNRSELQLAHARYRELVENIPGATAIYRGFDMEIVMVNKAMTDFWGKGEEVVGKTLLEAVPELNGQNFIFLLQQVYTTGETYKAKEAKADLMVGGRLQAFYFDFTYRALRDIDGNIEGIIHSAADVTELVLARKRASEAESRLHFSLESAAIGTWDLDPINQHITWDRRCKELYGFTRDEDVTYDEVLKYIHPDDVASVDQAVRRAVDPASDGKYDIRFRTIGNGNDQVRWLHCSGQAYVNSDNVVYRFSGIARDISSEVSARQDQEKLLWMIDNTNDFISLSEWGGMLTYLNKSGQRMMGFDNLEEAKRENTQYLVPEEVPLIKEINKHLLEHGIWTGILHYKNVKSGEIIPGYVTSLLVRDEHGRPLARASVVRDLRAEREAQDALIRSEGKFEFVTDFMPQQVWTTDAEGSFDFVNKQLKDYCDADTGEFIGDKWTQFIHEDDKERVMQSWQNSIRTGAAFQNEFRLKGKDGQWRWHLSRAIPLLEKDKITKWFGTNTDIDDQKRSLAKKDEFISVASHELKTPMTSLKASIQFLTQLYNKNIQSDKIKPLLGKANSSLVKLSHLIEDLLNVTKLEEGQLILKKSSLNLCELIHDSCEHLRIADTHEITIECNEELLVEADAHRLDQVIVNLINNAVKYAPQSNRISVRAERIPGFIKVSVQDYGIGIPQEKMPYLFDRYYRVDVAGNQFSGLGLGLYISNEIIRRHGGEMTVESETGKGSTFSFTLPF